MTRPVSKSGYLRGLQCPLLLWTQYNCKQDIPPPGASTQAIFDLGHSIGRLAQTLWSNGEEIPMTWDLQSTASRTSELLTRRIPVFEASFLVDRRYCRVDILEPADSDTWNLIEVKAGTSVKPVNLDDIAFQADTLRRAGIELRELFLMHIDNQYFRRGDLDASALLKKECVTTEARALQDTAATGADEMFVVIDGPEPEVPIGLHCDSPYECPLKYKCWSSLPEHNPLHLYRFPKENAFAHIHAGRTKINDVPRAGLSEIHGIQQRAVESGEPHTDPVALRHWLDALEYPLYHLDFETISPGIPLFDGTRPYQRIPFQFSLHIQDTPGAAPRHAEFLELEARDPRPGLVDALEQIGPGGTVLAWNMSFERGVLEELAGAFPDRAAFLHDLVTRMQDLIVPFRNFHIYHPAQQGSCSVKKVLPAFTTLGYQGLDIHEGGQASWEYLRVVHGESSAAERAKVLADLRIYCALDTMAMVELLRVVEGYARQTGGENGPLARGNTRG